MSNTNERTSNKLQKVYYITYGLLGSKFFAIKEGYIEGKYNKKSKCFGVYGENESFYEYESSHFGKYVFYNKKNAEEFVNRLPSKGTWVYIISKNVVFCREVKGYISRSNKNKVDICIFFSTGEEIPISEFDNTLFFTYEDAVENL